MVGINASMQAGDWKQGINKHCQLDLQPNAMMHPTVHLEPLKHVWVALEVEMGWPTRKDQNTLIEKSATLIEQLLYISFKNCK